MTPEILVRDKTVILRYGKTKIAETELSPGQQTAPKWMQQACESLKTNPAKTPLAARRRARKIFLDKKKD